MMFKEDRPIVQPGAVGLRLKVDSGRSMGLKRAFVALLSGCSIMVIKPETSSQVSPRSDFTTRETST